MSQVFVKFPLTIEHQCYDFVVRQSVRTLDFYQGIRMREQNYLFFTKPFKNLIFSTLTDIYKYKTNALKT